MRKIVLSLILCGSLSWLFGTQLVKTVNGLAIASVKTEAGLAIASVKTINGLDNTASGETTFITGQSLGPVRNDFSGGVGFQFVVGGADVVVSSLGRWVISGNSGTHVLRIRNSSGTDLGNVTVNTSGATTAAFLYGTLATPITLTAASTYYMLSDESNNGDNWNNEATVLTHTTAASITKGAYYNGGLNVAGGEDSTFGAVSFKYTSP